MSNAIKYTQKGYVKVEAHISIDDEEIMLTVVDSGVGICPDKLPDLFTAFKKIKRHRELNTEGAGLGLTISKNLAKAMGGDINVVSNIEVGSKFTVNLPLVKVEKDDDLIFGNEQTESIIEFNAKNIERMRRSNSDSSTSIISHEDDYSMINNLEMLKQYNR